MYRLLAFVIASPAVIADLIRNPVLANTGCRIGSGMTERVISGIQIAVLLQFLAP